MAGWTWATWAAGGVLGLAGLAVVAWALLRDRSRGRRRCPRCWYEMTGVPGLKCPECGREAKTERRLLRTRRRWRWAAAGVVMLAAGATIGFGPAAAGDWLLAQVPVRVWVLVLPLFDSQAKAAYARNSSVLTIGMSSRWERLLVARHLAASIRNGTMTATTRQVQWLLPALGDEAAVAVPTLIEALDDPGASVRETAAWALREIRPGPKSAVLPLAGLVRTDKIPEVRFEAIRALVVIEGDRALIPTFIQALADEYPGIRTLAATGLSKFGREALPGMAALAAAAHDADQDLAEAVVGALRAIGPESVEPLTGLLRDGDLEVRRAAPHGLRRFGPGAASATPALEAALKDKDIYVRLRCCRALGAIGPGASDAVPALIEVLESDRSATVRLYAADALAAIDAAGNRVTDALGRALADEQRDVRIGAARHLGERGARAARVRAQVAAAQGDPDSVVQRAAAAALGAINAGR